jgi:hypothetical protein
MKFGVYCKYIKALEVYLISFFFSKLLLQRFEIESHIIFCSFSLSNLCWFFFAHKQFLNEICQKNEFMVSHENAEQNAVCFLHFLLHYAV